MQTVEKLIAHPISNKWSRCCICNEWISQ